MVGGDGVIYEGRSWSFQPDLPPELAHLEEDCIDIAYIGDFAGENSLAVLHHSVKLCEISSKPKFSFSLSEKTFKI